MPCTMTAHLAQSSMERDRARDAGPNWATSDAQIPVSTSPEPPVASAGDPACTLHEQLPSLTVVRDPFRITTAPMRCASAIAAE